MALSTLAKEEENFLRYAILIVDHSKEALQDLVELDLKNKHLTFEEFININQHLIYHLCYDLKCCQCQKTPSRRKRILSPYQLELLFDKYKKLPSHMGIRHNDFCCSYAKADITSQVLDLSLARCLLVNCCLDVFWFSCLTSQGQTLEQFLNLNKHIIYHLWINNKKCCQCPAGFIFPREVSIITENEWRDLFSSVLLPCINDRKRTKTGTTCVCSFAAKPGIDVKDIHPEIQGEILKLCCSVRNSVEKLVEHRNINFGHASTAKLSEVNFENFSKETEECILDIVRIFRKEFEVKDAFNHLRSRPIDARLCSHYQNKLLENIVRNEDINENINSEHIQTRKELSCKIMKLEKEVQDLRTQFIDGSRRSQHIRETLAEIDNHKNDKTYTFIKAVSECCQILEKRKVLILSGREGSGKSKNSLEILRQMKEKHPETDVIKLKRFNEFTGIIDTDKMTIVLFEDVFGRISKQFCENNDIQILDILHSYINLGIIRVIFVMRNTVKHECKDLLSSHVIFCHSTEVDLNSKEFALSQKEKQQIFINYCMNNEIEIIYKDMSSHHDPNEINIDKIKVSTIDKSEKQFRLSTDKRYITFNDEAVEDMIRSDPYHGFPQCCRLFTKNLKFTVLGAAFFKYPLKSLLQEIENMRMEGIDNEVKGLKYVILVFIILNQVPSVMSIDTFAIHSIYATEFTELDNQVMLPINVNSIDVKAHQKLFNECYNKNFKLKLHDIMNLYEELTCRYLTRKENKIYFQHRALQDSVLISYSKTNPKAIIPLLSSDHMIDIVRPQNYIEQEDEIVIKISKPNYDELAKKIISLMNGMCFAQSKLDRMMESKIITENDVDLIYELIVCINNGNDNSSSRLSLIFRSDIFHYFQLYLLRNIGKLDKKMLTVNHTNDRMLISVTIGDKNTSLSVDPYISLIKAFQSKYKDIVEWLLKNTDHSLLEFTNIFTTTMPDRVLEYTKLLLENVKHNMIDMTELFMTVCCKKSIEKKPVLDWILDNVDNSSIDYHKCIVDIIYDGFPDIILHIIEKVNQRWLNINEVIKVCCEFGCSEIVEWALKNIDHELFDEEELFNITIDGYEDHNDLHDDDCDCRLCVGYSNILELFILHKPGILKCVTIKRLFDQVIRKKWYGVLELLFKYDSNISINTDQIIEGICKHWDNEEDDYNMFQYDDAYCRKMIQLVMKYCSNYANVNKIIENACQFGIHNIVEELLLEKLDKISYILDITLDNLRNQQLNDDNICFDTGHGKILMLLLPRINYNIIDLNSVMNTVCHIGHSSAVLWLLENKPAYPYDMKNVMNKACFYGDLKLVEYLYQKYNEEDFDYKTAMLKACRNGQRKTLDVGKWLWENIHRSMFDMNAALNNASRCDNTEVVEWILNDVDKELFDTKAALICACGHGKYDTVELLLDKSSINMIDFEYAIILACKNEKSGFQITKLLYERADKSTLDTNTILADACKCFNNDIIQWIIETCDQNITVTDTSDGNSNLIYNPDKNLIDMNRAINCIIDMDAPEQKTKNLDYTKYNLLCLILKQSDLRTIDLNKILTESCKKDWLEMFRCLLRKVNHALFNIREMINVACQCGAFNIVKWSLENIDVKYLNVENVMVESCAYGWLECLVLIQKHCNQYEFNVHTAMVEACTYGRINIAQWLLQNVNCQCFNLPLLLQEAGRNGWMNIFSWLLRKVQFRTSDMHVATNEALANGHLQIVEMMLSVIGREWLDLSSFSEKIYLDSGKEAVLNFLLQHFDPNLLDIATVMTKACTFGWKDTAAFIIDNDLSSPCDFTLAFETACNNGETDIVKLLLENVDHKLFTVDKALLAVAVKGWDEIALLLLDKFEHTRLNVGNAFIEACRHGEIDVSQAILCKVEPSLLDVNTALNKACESHMHEDIVLLILENIDQEHVDLKAVRRKAIRHNWRKVKCAMMDAETEDPYQAEEETEIDCIVIS